MRVTARKKPKKRIFILYFGYWKKLLIETAANGKEWEKWKLFAPKRRRKEKDSSIIKQGGKIVVVVNVVMAGKISVKHIKA